MKNKKRITYMVLASLFAAIIAIFTAWFFHIPIKIGANSAYLHFGDTFIFLTASLLPWQYSALAAGIGGGLGDLFCGAAEWMPFTIIIKVLISLCFTSKSTKLLSKRNISAPVIALFITVCGYYIAEALLFGNWISPLVSIWGNVAQIGGSAALYYILAAILQKFNIKKAVSGK